MTQQVLINDMTFNALNLQIEEVSNNGSALTKIKFDFKVTSDDYHDVTTLLYKNDFNVSVPHKNLTFPAIISNYATSITNLYESGKTGDFSLELTEKK